MVAGMAAYAHTSRGLALIGGYMSSEVLAASREDADVVKVFPAARRCAFSI